MELEKVNTMGVKEAYQKKVDEQLREWQAWIEQYKMDDPKPGNPAKRRQMVERLELGYLVARGHLDELYDAQSDQWDASKQAVEYAMIDLKRILDESGAVQNAKHLTLHPTRSYAYDPFYRRS